MANYRIKLSDGTITIDLFGGTDSKLREGGLEMPPPQVRDSYVSNPFSDGARLSASKYENRIITINTKIYGSSLADLKTNIRTIQRLLNDAEERTLSGYGAQVYLEYQWGDTDAQSTYFDILRGDLSMPRDYVSTILNKFYIPNAVITLVCKPFGRYTNQDIAQATLENSQSAYDIKESFLVDDDSDHAIYGNNWECQTFTTTSAFTAVGAAIKLYRIPAYDASLSGVTLTLALYATSGGLPTGSPIAIKSGIDASKISSTQGDPVTRTYIGWIRGIFTTPVALANATVYALVAYLSAGDAANNLKWESDSTAGYAAGQRGYSTNGGGAWTADATDDNLFAIYAAEATQENFQDITTAEGYGDVPAKLYVKAAQTGATGSKKVWAAKRSGFRQTDDLWIEGEDFSSFTYIGGYAAEYYYGQHYVDAAVSGELFGRAHIMSSAIAANTDLSRLNYAISALPRGQFRVLVKCKVICDDVADYDHLSFGFGWGYGDKTYTPTEARGEYYQVAAHNTWQMLDLGILNIPPIAESDIASNSSFELRMFQHNNQAITVAEVYNWDIDWIFLLPLDEGVVIVDSVAAADVLALDGITDPPNVFIVSSGDAIENYPDYVGAPFKLGRESTRLYVLRDDVKAVTFAVDTKYQPQFLII